MTPEPLRIALIGAGRIGQVHAASIARSPRATLQVVCDVFEQSAQDLAARHGARASSEPEASIEAADVDAVIVASSTPTHVDLMRAALRAGKPVLCEKPIDLDITRVEGLRGEAEGAARPVMLGFNRRFDPHFAAVHARVAAGEIGRLEQLTITSRDPAPAPRGYLAASGGIFRDMTIHDLDMARFFVPDIVEVSATGYRHFSSEIAELDDFDAAVVTLTGAGGESIVITNSRHSAYGYDQRLEAFGPDGRLAVDNLSDTVVRAWTATSTAAGEPHQQFFLERYAEAYYRELEAFVSAAVADGAGVAGATGVPGFADGRSALILADACEESARKRHAVPVDLR
ncbi:inositol 2-dehydrogenase [Kineococcus sp. SYSU DK003]|uniref:inositol 2-dehydrogenase n=1 Tax=Kineococcus sp. SYSU DK003 TaxID=3383124 RepID=UPI003D7E2025